MDSLNGYVLLLPGRVFKNELFENVFDLLLCDLGRFPPDHDSIGNIQLDFRRIDPVGIEQPDQVSPKLTGIDELFQPGRWSIPYVESAHNRFPLTGKSFRITDFDKRDVLMIHRDIT